MPSNAIYEYHHVYGIELDNIAYVASYFHVQMTTLVRRACFISSFHQPTHFTPTSQSNSFKFLHGTYCVFDCFSRMDVRVEISASGAMHSYVVAFRFLTRNRTSYLVADMQSTSTGHISPSPMTHGDSVRCVRRRKKKPQLSSFLCHPFSFPPPTIAPGLIDPASTECDP
jgi:hypothetical protein